MATGNATLHSALGSSCPRVVQGWSRGGPTFEHLHWDRETVLNAYKAQFFTVVQVVQGETIILRDTGGNATGNALSEGVCVVCNTPEKGGTPGPPPPKTAFSSHK